MLALVMLLFSENTTSFSHGLIPEKIYLECNTSHWIKKSAKCKFEWLILNGCQWTKMLFRTKLCSFNLVR